LRLSRPPRQRRLQGFSAVSLRAVADRRCRHCGRTVLSS
jgi:hypothetical protein